MANDPFSDTSFIWRVKIRADRPHKLKHHGKRGTVVHELLGILDLLAAKDPHRFVFASNGGLVDLCNKKVGKDVVCYTLRWVKYALAEFRARHIISPYFHTYDGRYGFVVAPHESLCHRQGDVCIMRTPKKFEYTAEQAVRLLPPPPTGLSPLRKWPGWDARQRTLRKKKAGCNSVELSSSSVELDARTSLLTSPATSPVTSPDTSPATSPVTSPETDQNFTSNFTGDFTGQAPQSTQTKLVAEVPSANRFADGIESGFASLINRSTGEPEEPKEPVSRAHTNQPTRTYFLLGAAPQPPVNEKVKSHDGDKTIGDMFEGWTWERMDQLTDGELNTQNRQFQSYEHEQEMEATILAVIAERNDEPFRGRLTCAALMNAAMARLKKEQGLDAPACWLPVIRTLRDEHSKPVNLCDNFAKQPNGRPIFSSAPNPYQPGDAWEMCIDGIRRCKVDREAYGFTVRAEDKVWERPAR